MKEKEESTKILRDQATKKNEENYALKSENTKLRESLREYEKSSAEETQRQGEESLARTKKLEE